MNNCGMLWCSPSPPHEPGVYPLSCLFASLVKDEYVGKPDVAHKHVVGEVIIQSMGRGERKLVLHLVRSVEDDTITTSAHEWTFANWEGGDFVFHHVGQSTVELRVIERDAHQYLTLDRFSPHHHTPSRDVFGMDKACGALVLQEGMARATRDQLGRCGRARILRTHGGDQHLSEGSPPDDTDRETSGPHVEHDFDTVSDGSLHDFHGKKGYMAGAAAVGLGDDGHVQGVMKNIPNKVAWATDNTATRYDPVHPSSFTTEAEGVHLFGCI
jgi:hypothetical protein